MEAARRTYAFAKKGSLLNDKELSDSALGRIAQRFGRRMGPISRRLNFDRQKKLGDNREHICERPWRISAEHSR
jgi:hypothetical protein